MSIQKVKNYLPRIITTTLGWTIGSIIGMILTKSFNIKTQIISYITFEIIYFIINMLEKEKN